VVSSKVGEERLVLGSNLQLEGTKWCIHILKKCAFSIGENSLSNLERVTRVVSSKVGEQRLILGSNLQIIKHRRIQQIKSM
jgi:hypothetical protein